MKKQPQFIEFRNGCFNDLEEVIDKYAQEGNIVYFVDKFFEKEGNNLLNIKEKIEDIFIFVHNEPTTEDIDNYVFKIESLINIGEYYPSCIVAIGGGSTMDTAKAVSVMLSQEEFKTEDYVGFNKVKNEAIFKIGIPTISGTGAEVSSSAVLMNSKTKVKLGINSDECVFDVLLLDPKLLFTVPKEQSFYTLMDCYIHCIESKNGQYRNFINDEYGNSAIEECEWILDNPNDDFYQEKMYTSLIGGYCTGCTGLIHPIGAGLSTLGINHGESVVLALNALKNEYEFECSELQRWLKLNNIKLRENVCENLTKEQWKVIYNAVLTHEKPLENHFGKDWKKIMTKKKIKEIMINI